MLDSTGQDEISLSSLSSSDYSKLEELVTFLMETGRERMVNILCLLCALMPFSGYHEQGTGCEEEQSYFAPEAGSQRLRDVINKG